MRAALHFDTLEVDKGGERLTGPRLIDVVDIESDAGVGIRADRLGVDSANIGSRIRSRPSNRKTGCNILQPRHIGDVLLGQCRAGHSRNRERHILQILRDTLGSDDDVPDRIGIFLGRGGLCNCGSRNKRGCQCDYRDGPVKALHAVCAAIHVGSPPNADLALIVSFVTPKKSFCNRSQKNAA